MPKIFNDLKVGDEVAILGWFEDSFGSDELHYELRKYKVLEIKLFPLYPTTDGMIQYIRTNNFTDYKHSNGGTITGIKKTGSVHIINLRLDQLLYCDKDDIHREEIKLKEKHHK
jgi:hypothetical protein